MGRDARGVEAGLGDIRELSQDVRKGRRRDLCQGDNGVGLRSDNVGQLGRSRPGDEAIVPDIDEKIMSTEEVRTEDWLRDLGKSE